MKNPMIVFHTFIHLKYYDQVTIFAKSPSLITKFLIFSFSNNGFLVFLRFGIFKNNRINLILNMSEAF